MIKIDISTATAIYLFCSVIVTLLIWLLYEYSWKVKRDNLDKRFVWQCSVCFYMYVDSKHDAYSVCPQCGSYNERKLQARSDGKNNTRV